MAMVPTSLYVYMIELLLRLLTVRQGIFGADPVNPFNISGVAFEASINAYRIFGCDGSVTDDSEALFSVKPWSMSLINNTVIVEALLQGVKDGNHILTMSLGGSDGWTESSSSVVSSRIAATGRIVTIAAGVYPCLVYRPHEFSSTDPPRERRRQGFLVHI